MKKILMRSPMPFAHDKNISEILVYNLIGSNMGNLLFHNSVARMLITSDDVEIVTIKIKKKYTDEEIERINTEYELFVIPLANAFRVTFMDELRRLTDLVRRLKIPCVVIGIGIQKSLDDRNWDFEYDRTAEEFLKEVLDKSTIVGVRGEVTAEYLKRRGFTPEKDFTVIGCPSLYTFGDNLPSPRLVDLTPDAGTAVNFKAALPPALYHFLRKEAEKFKDSIVTAQVIEEIRSLYIGYPYPEKEQGSVPEDYPVSFTGGLMAEDRMLAFLDEKSWLTWLGTRDFSFGSRIHGNIAGVLAGTPCFIFAGDYRVKELAEYHNIPHLSYKDLKEDTNVIDLYNKTDYGVLLKGHKERVTHYLDFLDKNHIRRISREVMNSNGAPFDKMTERWNSVGTIRPFSVIPLKEQEQRIREYIQVMEDKERAARKELLRYRDISEKYIKSDRKKQGRIRYLEKELEKLRGRKFYKMQMKYDEIKKKTSGFVKNRRPAMKQNVKRDVNSRSDVS